MCFPAEISGLKYGVALTNIRICAIANLYMSDHICLHVEIV